MRANSIRLRRRYSSGTKKNGIAIVPNLNTKLSDDTKCHPMGP